VRLALGESENIVEKEREPREPGNWIRDFSSLKKALVLP
jgi:hypothetical protein